MLRKNQNFSFFFYYWMANDEMVKKFFDPFTVINKKKFSVRCKMLMEFYN